MVRELACRGIDVTLFTTALDEQGSFVPWSTPRLIGREVARADPETFAAVTVTRRVTPTSRLVAI